LDGSLADTSSDAAASFSWETTRKPNGICTITAKAYDAAGNVGTSAQISVSVQNVQNPAPDVVAPVVQITSPTSGASVSRNTKVSVIAADAVGVTRVDLLVDGQLYMTSPLTAPIFGLYANKLTRGSHSLQAVAYDAAGNGARSTAVTVYR
jgi:hypothetical protein